MAFCLPRFTAEKLKKELKFSPNQLKQLTSAERNKAFSDIVGEVNAKQVNALFESKLLLKNQKLGIENWGKQIFGMKPELLRDTLSKVQKLDKVMTPKELDMFLEDLVEKKLGFGVSVEEAGKLVDLAKRVEEAKSKIPEDSPVRSQERLEYGTANALFREYVETLKLNTKELPIKEYLKPENYGKGVVKLAGIFKSLLSSLDNSFFGRQGFKVLMTNPDIWIKNFGKSWGDIVKELGGVDSSLLTKSDIYSRSNAINGKYQKGDLAVGLKTEEAYPSSLPTRIPLLGRLFKASESAYNNAALRMRADLFDRYVSKAESKGVDLSDTQNLKGIGKLTNSMTGRGSLGKAEAALDTWNVLFFSPRFLKSQVDLFTQPFNSKLGSFAKKQAAINLAQIVGETALTLYVANQLFPNSVDSDPRSANFGKIKIGNTRFDIAGGHMGLITLASRLVPTVHNGKLGFWFKSSTNGKYYEMGTGKYGSSTPTDVLFQFAQGKASPVLRSVYTAWEGEDFAGNKATLPNIGLGLVKPLPIATYEELKNDPKSANILLSMILSEIGWGVNTYGTKK